MTITFNKQPGVEPALNPDHSRIPPFLIAIQDIQFVLFSILTGVDVDKDFSGARVF